jgi:transcriptional regulator with XRE-family HTH domain
MGAKPRPLIVEVADFHVYLKARLYALGLTVPELAQQIGITTAAVYALMNEELQPSDEVLSKVGLRTAYVADEKGSEEAAKPAGRGKK